METQIRVNACKRRKLSHAYWTKYWNLRLRPSNSQGCVHQLQQIRTPPPHSSLLYSRYLARLIWKWQISVFLVGMGWASSACSAGWIRSIGQVPAVNGACSKIGALSYAEHLILLFACLYPSQCPRTPNETHLQAQTYSQAPIIPSGTPCTTA